MYIDCIELRQIGFGCGIALCLDGRNGKKIGRYEKGIGIPKWMELCSDVNWCARSQYSFGLNHSFRCTTSLPPNIIRILENIRAVYTRNFNNRQIPKMDLSIENPNGKVYNWITAKYAAALNLIWQPSICLIRHPCYRSLASIIALFAHWIVHLPGAIDAASRFGFGESLFD